jgi:hypothetical protein
MRPDHITIGFDAEYSRSNSFTGNVLGAVASFCRYPEGVAGWFDYPMLFLAAALLVLLFPDGPLPDRRWRVVPWVAVGGSVLWTLRLATAPTAHGISRLPGLGCTPPQCARSAPSQILSFLEGIMDTRRVLL